MEFSAPTPILSTADLRTTNSPGVSIAGTVSVPLGAKTEPPAAKGATFPPLKPSAAALEYALNLSSHDGFLSMAFLIFFAASLPDASGDCPVLNAPLTASPTPCPTASDISPLPIIPSIAPDASEPADAPALAAPLCIIPSTISFAASPRASIIAPLLSLSSPTRDSIAFVSRSVESVKGLNRPPSPGTPPPPGTFPF